MGYSAPKKQLDLKEFLSQPAKNFPVKRFGVRKAPAITTKPAASAASGKDKGGACLPMCA